MLINERTLFIDVTLNARCIGACSESCLFKLETAVWIVAVAALHRPFEHLVMERQIKLVLGLAVTTQAKLWLTFAEQLQIRDAGFLCICCGHEYIRGRDLSSGWCGVG